MKKHILLSAVSVLLSVQMILAQKPVWTLEDCIHYAIANNISIRLSENDLSHASINIKDAKGNFLPSVSGNASHSWAIGLNQNITTGLLENQTTQFTAFGLSVGYDLFTGLQNINRLRRSEMALVASRYQIRKIQEDIALNVANAYLQVLFSKENLKIAREQLANNRVQYDALKHLVEGGQLAKVQLYDLEATLAADELRVVQAVNQEMLSKIALIQLMQLNDFEDFEINDNNEIPFSEGVFAMGPEAVYERSRTDRTELQIARENINIAKSDIEIAEGARYPRLVAFYNANSRIAYLDQIAGYSIDPENPVRTIGYVQGSLDPVVTPNQIPVIESYDPFFRQLGNNLGHSFGLSLSVPIFSKNQIKNNVQRSQVSLERAQLLLRQEDENLKRNIYTAYYDALGARNTYEAAVKTVEAREAANEFARERFEGGFISAFELGNTQTLLVNAQTEVIRSKYDYIFRMKILEFYFGVALF